uniref:Glycosyltransferase n=1 Tax=Arabidopsis thaliana TaxID=3702 RepID=Q5UB80_ARATH|nr:UDP-glucuronosyltransferase [Arabidopsis thaliana]
MASPAVHSKQKPHVVCVPHPAQGHINPMLKVAKLLHARGFHVTFVNTVYNHNRLLRSRGPYALDGLPSFRFESIADGLPDTDGDKTQDIPALCVSTMKNCLAPFKELLRRINDVDDVPPVSCIVSDGVMSFTLDAAEELNLPEVIFWTNSACGFMTFLHFYLFIEKGLSPFKVIILNTFDDLDHDLIQSMQSILLPPVYTIGPLHLLANQEIDEVSEIGRMGLNLWKEDTECLDWLDSKTTPNSVVFVNFGCITVMSAKQLLEFAWGLAASGKEFLWVIRPDLVAGETTAILSEFLTETADRGMLVSWCSQEKVISHPMVGGFLTHCGWNSTLESISGGVPIICWPFFAEQQTNCKFCCDEWGVGVEIGGDVKREEVETVVRELMDREKGKKMREKAVEWRRLANEATEHKHGSSVVNFETVVRKVLLRE